MRKYRRIKICLLVLVLVIAAGFGLSTFIISPDAYQLHQLTIRSKKIPAAFNDFRILFFSDVHLNDHDDVQRFKEAVKAMNEEPFAMALFGGDLYENKVIAEKEVRTALNSIQTTYGKFAILGDEDVTYASEITELLNSAGFEVLNNVERPIYYKNAEIRLTGYATSAAAPLAKSSLYTIALSHYPDLFASAYKNEDYHIAGHSGGGYFYLPWIGPLIKVSHAKTYTHGSYHKDSATLYVSNGLSVTSTHRYKFLCKNEFVIFTLKHI